MTTFQILMAIVIWWAFAVIVGVIADKRGKSGFLFFCLSLAISPLLALIILVCIPAEQVMASGKTKCPHCHGVIDINVSCCMHCRRDIIWPSAVSPQTLFKNLVVSKCEATCPDCGKGFPVLANRGIVEMLCPHCQAILKLDTVPA